MSSCRHVRDWLHLESEALDEAQRLVLDDHLAACEKCRGDRARMQLVHRLGTSLDAPPADAREYNRAIARALLEGAPKREAAPARRGWTFAIAGLALAAAAAIAIVVGLRGRDDAPSIARASSPDPRDPSHAPDTRAPSQSPESRAPSQSPESRDPSQSPESHDPTHAPGDVVVVDGTLRASDTTLVAGAALPANTSLVAVGATHVKIGDAHVVIAADARVQWLDADRALVLERGGIEWIDGDARVKAGDAHVALAARARVQWLPEKRALLVENGTIEVIDGTLRVADRNRIVELAGREQWTAPEPIAKKLASIAELLAKAQKQFAAKEYGGARGTLAEVLRRKPVKSDEVTARVLLADVAQAEGKLDEAVAKYVAVANAFADAPAGESALYAAARLELRRGRDATALLEKYLARYPKGRYVVDVRRELATRKDAP